MDKKVIRKALPFFLIFLSVVAVVLLNLDIGNSIMGLDNFSPYFDGSVNLYRIINTDTFFVYGGLVFLPWVHLLAWLSVPPWLISQLFLWGTVLLGIGGALMLLRSVLSGQKSSFKKRPQIEKILLVSAVVLSLASSLVTIWIVNQPNVIFLSAFAGIPVFIHFLITQTKKLDWKKVLYWVVGLLFLAATSLNLVAFTLFVIQGVVLAVLFSKIFLKLNLKDILLKTGIFLGSLILIVQLFLLFTPSKRIITAEIYLHLQDVAANEMTVGVSQDLRASEVQNNSVINVARFATGWMELHTDDGKAVFEHYSTYMSNPLIIVLGLAPVLVSLVAYPRVADKNKKAVLLYIALGVAILLMSRYGVMIYEKIPLVRDGLRWASSKLWPLLFYPLFVLFTISLFHLSSKMKQNHRYILYGVVFAGLVIHAFPWWTGTVISSYAQNKIPREYKNVFSDFDEDDTVLYLPLPQSSYFRRYGWGYFGSDFLNYVTKADVVDSASLSNYRVGLEAMEDAFMVCKWGYLTGNGIDYVVYDESVSGALDLPGCVETHVLSSNGSLTVVAPNLGE